MHKTFLLTAALAGAVSVALGAFAAHGLRKMLQPESLQVFETGVKYQFYHALALLAVGILWQQFAGQSLLWSGRLFITGLFLFSGSLYLLTFIRHYGWGATWVGAITPLGGLCFIAGWILLAMAVAGRNPQA